MCADVKPKILKYVLQVGNYALKYMHTHTHSHELIQSLILSTI
jgi:hypothetical protein